jgi:phosphoserine phosphatase RsbU/P
MDSLLNLAPCGYISFRDDGIIVQVNQTLSVWLGYSSEELIGKNIDTILTLASRIFYNTHFFPVVKLHDKAEEIFLSLQTKTKADIPVITNAERRLTDNAYTIHCVFMAVYQRRKYEDEILKAKRDAENALKENYYLEELKNSLESRTLELDRQYQKQLSINENLLQFSKIISHDLQEPLRKIRIFTDIIEREEIDTLAERSKNAIQKIQASAERLQKLTTGLQQYVTVDAEKIHSMVDLNQILEIAKAKAIENRKFDDFDIVHAKLPVIEAFKTQMELLFYHLLDNAIQFRDPLKKLSINILSVDLDENIYRATKDKYKFDEHVKLVFSDNGLGFENQYKNYVFELLKKINPITEGLGIGLSLIKKIVDNHMGTLAVESEPNHGTKFTITLPLKMLAV